MGFWSEGLFVESSGTVLVLVKKSLCSLSNPVDAIPEINGKQN
jgi:hypothetical protein